MAEITKESFEEFSKTVLEKLDNFSARISKLETPEEKVPEDEKPEEEETKQEEGTVEERLARLESAIAELKGKILPEVAATAPKPEEEKKPAEPETDKSSNPTEEVKLTAKIEELTKDISEIKKSINIRKVEGERPDTSETYVNKSETVDEAYDIATGRKPFSPNESLEMERKMNRDKYAKIFSEK